MWRVPKLGPAIAKRRSIARLGWQANRLAPDRGRWRSVGPQLTDVRIVALPEAAPFDVAGHVGRDVRRRAPAATGGSSPRVR